MHLSDFMRANNLDDEGMAARVREDGTKCDRTTICRLRNGKVWLSRPLAARLKAVTGGLVTPDDVLEAAESAA